MVTELPYEHGDVYDEVEDLSQVEIIPPHEMLKQLKTVNVAGWSELLVVDHLRVQFTRVCVSSQC